LHEPLSVAEAVERSGAPFSVGSVVADLILPAMHSNAAG
jgi:hypothetical protein